MTDQPVAERRAGLRTRLEQARDALLGVHGYARHDTVRIDMVYRLLEEVLASHALEASLTTERADEEVDQSIELAFELGKVIGREHPDIDPTFDEAMARIEGSGTHPTSKVEASPQEDQQADSLLGTPGREESDAMRLQPPPDNAELIAALKGVIRVADRNTVEFDAAKAAIAKAEGREVCMGDIAAMLAMCSCGHAIAEHGESAKRCLRRGCGCRLSRQSFDA